MGIFSGIFKSRDAPTNRTAGSAYSFFLGQSAAGKRVNERSAMQTLAVEERAVNLKAKDTPFIGMNSWDGAYRIEIWKYPPIAKDRVVDKLSLALTLMSDDDPRVQKELKQMIESLW